MMDWLTADAGVTNWQMLVLFVVVASLWLAAHWALDTASERLREAKAYWNGAAGMFSLMELGDEPTHPLNTNKENAE